MKKNIALLSVLLMSTSLMAGLASCEKNPVPTPTPSTPTDSTPAESTPVVSTPEESTPAQQVSKIEYDPTAPVSIELYTTLSSTAKYGLLFDDYLNQFQELHPNITVTHTRVGGYNDVRDQLKTELGAGQGPNLAYCYPDHVALYNKARAVQTLDKFIYDTEVNPDYDETVNGSYELKFGLTEKQVGDFFDAYWEEGKAYGDGKMYTLPLYKSTEVLYYNKTVLDEEGLAVPTHWFKDDEGLTPETSMEYALEVLKAKYPSSTPLGYDSESNWFITMCEQLGSPFTSATGEHFLFDNEVNRDFVTRFKSWYDKGYVTTQEIYGGYTSAIFGNTTDSTITRSFLNIGSSAGATHQVPDVAGAFEVGIAPIPQANPDSPKAISQGPSLVMFKGEPQEVAASWLLMRYLTTNPIFQADFSASSGYVPSTEAVFENDIYNEWLDSAAGNPDGIAALSVKTCLEAADSFFTSPAFVGSSDARDQVGALIQAVFLNQMSVADAFEFAINECKEG